jgi:hypothetical protein
MTKIDRVLKKLGELYDFNRKLKAYKLKEKADKSLKEDAAEDRRAS